MLLKGDIMLAGSKQIGLAAGADETNYMFWSC
jgi:hypothetical protein